LRLGCGMEMLVSMWDSCKDGVVEWSVKLVEGLLEKRSSRDLYG
jgi:hypothetical protein